MPLNLNYLFYSILKSGILTRHPIQLFFIFIFFFFHFQLKVSCPEGIIQTLRLQYVFIWRLGSKTKSLSRRPRLRLQTNFTRKRTAFANVINLNLSPAAFASLVVKTSRIFLQEFEQSQASTRSLQQRRFPISYFLLLISLAAWFRVAEKPIYGKENSYSVQNNL